MPQPQASAMAQAGRQRGNSNVAAFRPSARWQLESYCGLCGAHFSYVRQRHHCRHCGLSVCGRHSRQRAIVPTSLSTLPQRVCDTCFPLCHNAPRRPRGLTIGAPQRSTGGASANSSSARSRRRNKSGRDATGSTYTDGSVSSSSDAVASPRIRSPRTLDHPRRGGQTPVGARKRAASSGDSIRSTKPLVSPLPVAKTLSTRKASEQNPSVCNTTTTASSIGTLSEISVSGLGSVSVSDGVALPATRSRPLPFRRKTGKARQSRMSRDASSSSFAIFSFASDSDSDSDSSSDLDDSDSDDSDELDSGRSAAAAAAAAASKQRAAQAQADQERAEKARRDAEAAARRKARARAVTPPTIDTSNRKILSIRKRTARPPSRKSLLREKESLDFGASSSSVGFGQSRVGGKSLEASPPGSEAGWDPAASTTSMITRKYLPQPASAERKLGAKSGISSSPAARWKERSALGKSAFKNSAGPRSRVSSLTDLDDEDAHKPRSSSVDSEECFSDEEAEALAQLITASRRHGRGQTLPDAVLEEEPTTTATYAIREPDRAAMAGVAALEQRILDAQRELPALLDELRAAKQHAARADRELRESRARVARYQKAQETVARAMRAARAAMAQREFLAAILELTRAAAIERTNATVWFLLAQCRLRVRQLADAEEACMTSVSLQPTAAGVALLGQVLQAQGRHDEAIECFTSALGRGGAELPR